MLANDCPVRLGRISVARAATHPMRCPRDRELTAIMKSRVPQKVRKSEI